MTESLGKLLTKLKSQPDNVNFNDVMTTIAANYDYTPTSFRNGQGDDLLVNREGDNEGSCKIFAFAQLQGLTAEETLACFGKYYRDDVLLHPQGVNHLNIRTFMRHGWNGIQFDAFPLALKKMPLTD